MGIVPIQALDFVSPLPASQASELQEKLVQHSPSATYNNLFSWKENTWMKQWSPEIPQVRCFQWAPLATIVKQDTVSGLSSRTVSGYLFIWSAENPDVIEWLQYCERAEPSTVAATGCFLENWMVQGYTGSRRVTWWSCDWLVGWLVGRSVGWWQAGWFVYRMVPQGRLQHVKTFELFSLVSLSLDRWNLLDWTI